MKPQHTIARRRAFHPAQWLALLWGLLLLGVLALPAHAADADDPPGRVGRLAELNGQVWIYATDSNEWIGAVRNRPVTTGDRLSTEADGRVEVRIGSTVLRLAPNTELEVLRLDDDRVSVHLHSGSMSARLRTREAADEFTLRTDEGRFRTERVGQYRFDRDNDVSSATAASGQAVYEADGTALPVQAGQRVEFWKDRGVPQYSITSPERDDFANWVASLDAREERSVSTRYVSPEMTGVEDLDRYGRWEPETEYGAVWIPRTVVAGWAPYRMGHWAWVSPWGWTWVDDAPWGFAPFHYGRWVWHRNAWCWAPGRYVARPVYAPALVAWVGGPNVSVSVRVGGAPSVGWFPLGPREVYVPGYRVSPRYVRNVNVTHVTNITNVTTIVNNPGRAMANTRYVNRGLPQAVTVVPSRVVERRQPVAPAHSPVSERVLRDITRERPRADPQVTAPPRFAPGAPRQVVDPRTSRPATPRPGAEPGRPSREVERGSSRPSVVAPGQQEPRVVQPRPTEPRDPRESRDTRDARDNRDPRFNREDRDERGSGRSGREFERGGREAPVRTLPAPSVQAPQAPQNPVGSNRPGQDDRGERPPSRGENPRVVPPPPQSGFRSDSPSPREGERVIPPPPREERRRQHHDASPVQQQPQVQMQPAPQPRQPQVQMPPPPRVQAPPPPQVVRPVQSPRMEAPLPQPRQEPEGRQRGRVDERSSERGERGERGERR